MPPDETGSPSRRTVKEVRHHANNGYFIQSRQVMMTESIGFNRLWACEQAMPAGESET